MKRIILGLISMALAACGGPAAGTQPSPTPDVVSRLIQQVHSHSPANPPGYIASYSYKGKLVYYVPPRCCDIFGDLYDSSGQLICHPDGGIAGHGDGRCPEFLSERTEGTIVWRDGRTVNSPATAAY